VTTCAVFKKHIGARFLNLVAWGGIEPPTQGFSTLIDRFELVVFQQSNTGQKAGVLLFV
jgi:hypothetical protein